MLVQVKIAKLFSTLSSVLLQYIPNIACVFGFICTVRICHWIS